MQPPASGILTAVMCLCQIIPTINIILSPNRSPQEQLKRNYEEHPALCNIPTNSVYCFYISLNTFLTISYISTTKISHGKTVNIINKTKIGFSPINGDCLEKK